MNILHIPHNKKNTFWICVHILLSKQYLLFYTEYMQWSINQKIYVHNQLFKVDAQSGMI